MLGNHFFQTLVPEIRNQVFWYSTSAGEVGVDLDADHMICDITTFDSIIQRLGRVNRSGGRTSKVLIVYEGGLKESRISKQVTRTIDLLKDLTKNGSFNASPYNINNIPHDKKENTFASKPEIQPFTVDISEMLALTSLRDRQGLRPEIHYWLRGKESNPPETRLVWREDTKYIAKLEPENIEDVLDRYSVLPHEIAREYSNIVYKFLNNIKENQTEKAIIIRSNGDCVSKTIHDIDENEIKFATIVLPCNVGGLDSDGYIGKSDQHVEDVADHKRYRERTRFIVEHNLDKDTHHIIKDIHGNDINEDLSEWLSKNPQMRCLWQIRIGDSEDEETYKEIQYYAKHAEQQLVQSTKEQTLQDHHRDVENTSKKITKSITLPDSIKEAVILACKFHDEGKARQHWQKCMHVEGNQTLAKTGRTQRPLDMGGFRHEFASIVDCINKKEIQGHSETDLILHLIASHHGWARPCFMPEVIHHEVARECEIKDIFMDVMRRYHTLQRRFGVWGLAWLEGLVRSADWQASENPGRSRLP